MNEREALRKILRENPTARRILERALDAGKLRSTDDLTDDEAVTFVCGSDHCGIDGSKQVQCACGNRVWMSPSNLEVMIRRGDAPMRILCLQCFMGEAKNEAHEKA